MDSADRDRLAISKSELVSMLEVHPRRKIREGDGRQIETSKLEGVGEILSPEKNEIQWNLSNPDTLGTEESVLISEVS